MLAEYPLTRRIQIGLRRPAFDLVQKGVLPLVGMRQIELVRKKQSNGDQRASQQHGNDYAINTDAGCFEGRYFVRALHQTKSDQYSKQDAVLRCVVEEIRRHVQ